MRIAVLLLVLAAGGEARAMCGTAHDALSPRAGTLPPRPWLYFFTRGQAVLWAAVDGQPVALRWEHVGVIDDDVVVWRLRVPAEKGRLVVSRWDARDYLDGPFFEHVYHIDPAWRRPEGRTETRVEVSRYQWTCSSEDALVVHPSIVAPAYRVEWAPTKLAFDRGMRRSFVWPTSSKNFWSQEPAEPSIGLGRLNCFVETVGANPLAVYWQITPLFPDGDTPHVPPPRASTSWGMALTAGQVYGPYLIGLGLLLLFVVRRRR